MSGRGRGELPLGYREIDEEWSRLDAELPSQYSSGELVKGHIGGVRTPKLIHIERENPRRRGSIVTNALSRLVMPVEQYREQVREVGIGNLPDSMAQVLDDARYEPSMLWVRDRLLSPIRPVDGNTAPVRHTVGSFVMHASPDGYGGASIYGLEFAFAGEVGPDDVVVEPMATVRLYSPGQSSVTGAGSWAGLEVQDWLTENELPELREDLPLLQRAQILGYCIDQALASKD